VIFQITACFLNLQASEFDHKKNVSKGNYVIGTWIYGDWTNLKAKKLWTYGGANASGPNPPYQKK